MFCYNINHLNHPRTWKAALQDYDESDAMHVLINDAFHFD